MIVCGECGQEWKQNCKKCWVCGNQRPMTRAEYDKLEADSQLVKIDGKLWRLTLEGGGVKWQSMEKPEPGVHTKQGQVDGCSLAEAPPCPMLEKEEDMGELTMADQVSLTHRIHIRQEIVENKPEKEDQHSMIRALAKTTDDIDPSQASPDGDNECRGPQAKEGPPGSQSQARGGGRQVGHTVDPGTAGLPGGLPRGDA